MQPSTSVTPINEIVEPINKSPSIKNKNTVQVPLLPTVGITEELESLSLSANDNKLQPTLAVNTEVAEPSDESLINNIDHASAKINVINKSCVAIGEDHSKCNGEPSKNQADLKLLSHARIGLGINFECPAQDPYQLGEKYTQFYRSRAVYGNNYFDFVGYNRLNDAYYAEAGYSDSSEKYTKAQTDELRKMYSVVHDFIGWVGDFEKKYGDGTLQQKKDSIIKRIDHEIALNNLFINNPNATLQEVRELYNKHHPLNTLDSV
ncbi:unnamed protein product [Rotaria magnacalcarata]|nr:unnamed protein product [Rotaria magnacalcarata]CAF4247639.1 unnamed protein product [Rotaria magnacalcarata]